MKTKSISWLVAIQVIVVVAGTTALFNGTNLTLLEK
ncbi:hypothetical protein BH18THE2_BH18THE2_06940 [soil metagenome]